MAALDMSQVENEIDGWTENLKEAEEIYNQMQVELIDLRKNPTTDITVRTFLFYRECKDRFFRSVKNFADSLYFGV